MLDDEPGFPQVRVDRREFWDKAPAEWIGEAEKIVAAGVSRPSEEGYTEVRTNIERVGREVESLFRAECRENKGRFLPAIRTCIDGLCKARTWVNPYHDRPSFGNFHGKYRSIELNCSEVAFKLAMGLDWLKGRLSDEDVTRAMSALDLHIIQPYLRSARTGDYTHHGWFLGNSNWNVACHWQSCCVALSVIRDKRVRAEFIESAERAAPYYLRGFSKEGYCQEGLDYWNYGFSEFLRLTHLLYNATKGGVDLSKLPKAKDCFLAPYLFQLANGCAPQFNDGTASVPSARTLYYGEFFWPEAHTAATKGVNPFSCGWCGYALIGARPVEAWWPPRRDGQPYKLPIRSFFEDAQILLVRPSEEGDDTMSACLKGGNNGVPHNHNDLGQFIIALGSTQMVQDPAGKVYDLETFTAKRYNHPMLNSYGHAVPMIDGTLQAAGRERTSKIVRTSFTDELDAIALDLTGAYTNAILKSLVREMTYRRPEGKVEISDRVEYARAGRFETPLSTYGKIERLGENDFVIVRETKNGVKRLAFTVDTQGAKWHVKEEKIPNPKRTEPTRWSVVFDEPATEFNVKFTFSRPVRAQEASIAALVREDLRHEVHPGGVEGRPFWNGNARFFMYAPSFDFPTDAHAVGYRFDVVDAKGRCHSFNADRPTASLQPVWDKLPTGWTSVMCRSLDKREERHMLKGCRTFWKSAPFTGAYPPAACPYATCAERALGWLFEQPAWKKLIADKDASACGYWGVQSYPTKMIAAVVSAICSGEPDPRRLAEARICADWLISVSEPAGRPLAFFPPTYKCRDPKKATGVVRDYYGQVMLVYPAQFGDALLSLWKKTGDDRYLAQAKGIAETYLHLQGEDGTWFLKMRTEDGREAVPNRLVPIDTAIPFLERMFRETGDVRCRAAADRAFAYVEKNLVRNWNWEGQFEDVDPDSAYRNLTKHGACAAAIYLCERFPNDTARVALARELLRFSEDQFVCWEKPFPDYAESHDLQKMEEWTLPGVLEQYYWYVPIDSSASKLIRTYLALYRVEKNPLDLAKARALADAMTRMQMADGAIPTHWQGKLRCSWWNCLLSDVQALRELDAVRD